jgi:hypothetical protein
VWGTELPAPDEGAPEARGDDRSLREPEVPATEEDVRALARTLQRVGPDEFPWGYYVHLARTRLEEDAKKRPRPGSVLW